MRDLLIVLGAMWGPPVIGSAIAITWHYMKKALDR